MASSGESIITSTGITLPNDQEREPACRLPAESGFRASPRARITVLEIAARLSIGRSAVYSLLENGIIPGIRFGQRWIVTRHAYESWEANCGVKSVSLCQ
jgi:excisionase family DNA binding protein